MLSPKNEAKQEARFAARLDVLSERVDTLASTVATTASAIAKKDGEIATLRRDLELRDQQLQSLTARASQVASPSDPQELHALRQAVAALQSERATKGNSKQLDEVMSKLNLLAERLDTLSATVSTTAAGLAGRDGEIAAIRKHLGTTQVAGHAAPTANPDIDRQVRELGVNVMSTNARLDDHTAELEVVKARLSEPHPHAEELRAMLTALRARVEALDSLRAGVTEEVLDERLAEPQATLAALGRRVDELTSGVESATAGLAAEDVKLEALQRQVTDSSSAAESTAELRERLMETETALEAVGRQLDKLGSLVESGTASLADNGQRLDTLERRHSESASRIEAVADDLRAAHAGVSEERLDERLAPTSTALRSLEKRIDELSSGVESATTSHADEEERLEALHRQVTDSSSRIESIADDLRDALAAFPEATPDQLGELGTRIESVEKRIASVAAEVARARTLWPVALRSLEARLDDVAPKHAPTDSAAKTAVAHDESGQSDEPEGMADDLLAELRDSLQAMESVAAELERTTNGPPPHDSAETPDAQQAVAGGARVVPLRTTDP